MIATIKAISRDVFMTDAFERGAENGTRDWRKYAIPAMGSIILILLGIIISLVTLDRSGIKQEIYELRTDFRSYKEKMDSKLAQIDANQNEQNARLREIDMMIRVPFNERAKILWGPRGRPYGSDNSKKGGEHGRP